MANIGNTKNISISGDNNGTFRRFVWRRQKEAGAEKGPQFHLWLVKVEIRDNGRGMSDRELRRVSTFEPNGCTLKPGGTGFGMSIVHKIVSAHGGTVEMSSAKQVGTVVTVYLPYKGK